MNKNHFFSYECVGHHTVNTFVNQKCILHTNALASHQLQKHPFTFRTFFIIIIYSLKVKILNISFKVLEILFICSTNLPITEKIYFLLTKLSIRSVIKRKELVNVLLIPIWGVNEIEPILMHMNNTEMYITLNRVFY